MPIGGNSRQVTQHGYIGRKEFEWDSAKAAGNLRKHKVTFKDAATVSGDELRPEYDLKDPLKGGVRGKYAKSYHAGSNVVLPDPDVRHAFRDERAVNDALRLVIELRKVTGRTRVTGD